MKQSWKTLSEKWGKVSPLNFKQTLVIAEMLGMHSGHPSEICAYADIIFGDKNPKEKESFMNVAVDTWEKHNVWDGVEEWVNVYKDNPQSNVVFVDFEKKIEF